MDDIDQYANPDLPKLLVGNKSDLESQRKVPIDAAKVSYINY